MGSPTEDVQLVVRNIGGIAQTQVTFSEGVTLLSGRNASNKSSLLRALAGVLGGPTPPLKSDAQEGVVELSVGDAEYRLVVSREGGTTVASERDVYADAPDLIEPFVALTETNPVRQAVVAGEELYPYLMAPVDTAAIEAEIDDLSAERRSLTDQLEELDEAADRLAACQEQRETVATDLATVEERLAERREEIADLEAAVAPDDTDSRLRELREKRSDLSARIRTHDDALTELREELETVRDRLADFTVGGETMSVEELDAELDALHRQKQTLAADINALSSAAELSGRLLDRDETLPEELADDDPISELAPSSATVTCWICGSHVERSAIADRAETLDRLVRERRNRRDELTERIQCLTERKRELEERQGEHEELQRREADLETEIEQRERTLTELRRDRRETEQVIERLQGDTADLDDDQTRLAEAYEAVSDLEYKRGKLEADLEELDTEIATLSERVAKREELAARLETVEERLSTRRSEIDQLEANLVETFNEEMAQTLDALAYDAVERVWLERAGDRSFRLNVVRTAEDGTAYADTIDSLSKSERAVVGLVVALSGYLVHDVRETVPFVVVDAVEMFDADRIRGLLRAFREYAPYLIAAVLPEERAELTSYDAVSPTADS